MPSIKDKLKVSSFANYRKKIHLIWYQHWIMGFLILSGLLVLISSVNLASDIGKPFGGFLTLYNPLIRMSVVTDDTPSWWPNIQQERLAIKDNVISIDGQPYNSTIAKTVFEKAYSKDQHTVNIVTRTDGMDKTHLLPIHLFTWRYFLDLQFVNLLLSLGYWLITFTIYRANPTNALHRLATILGSMLVLLGIGRAGLFWQDGIITKFFDIAKLVRSAFLGVLIMHFALHFPVRSRFLRKPILYILYGLASFAAICYTSSRIIFWHNGISDLVIKLDGYGFFLLWRLLAISLIFAFIRLLWYWLNPHVPRRHRYEVVTLLLGVVVALPHILLQISNALFGLKNNLFWNHLDLRYLLLAIPIAESIILLRYKTFRYAPPQLLVIPMLMSSSLLASVGSTLLFVMQPDYFSLYPIPPFFLLFFPTLIASIVWGTQSSWRGLFGRILHREQNNYASISAFGKYIIEQKNTTETPALIINALQSELDLENVAIWLWHPENELLLLAGQTGMWHKSPPTQMLMPLNASVKYTRPIILHNSQKETLPNWLQPLQQFDDIEAIVPLLVSAQPVGLLALGKRWDEPFFDEHDLRIIELIGQQSALFLLTTVQVEKLRQIPQQIDQAQERERYRIAGELHDTVQQFLGRLPFYLEISRNILHNDPHKADIILQNCIDDITDAAKTVRHIRGNLAPTQLEHEFIHSIGDLISRFQFHNKITVQLKTEPILERLITIDIKHALYRVIQQSLDNIAKHAHAQQVTVTLSYNNGKIMFSIVDNGVGSSIIERDQARTQGSFGLQSMQARIDAVGGKFSFKSSPGKGTYITGWVPENLSMP